MCDIYEAIWNGKKVAVKIPRIDPRKNPEKRRIRTITKRNRNMERLEPSKHSKNL